MDKVCFSHDAVYSEYKDLAERTISDKILKDKSYETAWNRTYDWYQRPLANMAYEFFHKETGSRISLNEQLAEELHKPVIKKFQKKKSICEI